MQLSHYVLDVGESALARYQLLENALGPNTRKILDDCQIKPNATVAELGCGIGITACYLAEHCVPNGKVIAVDGSQDQINIAKNLAEQKGLSNIEFICCDLETLELDKDAIDVIHTRLVLIYLNDPDSVVRKCYQWLKPGGVFVAEEHAMQHMTNTTLKEIGQKVMHWFWELGKANQQDFNYGETRLLETCASVGMKDIHVNIQFPYHTTQETIQSSIAFLSELQQQIQQHQIAKQNEIEQVLAELKAYQVKPYDYMTYFQVNQIRGWK